MNILLISWVGGTPRLKTRKKIKNNINNKKEKIEIKEIIINIIYKNKIESRPKMILIYLNIDLKIKR